ncbi:hypothetical protein [Streptomyces sp.]|uniref:hypothetical protein n=1 Tax=Streptomyces sp. TaxID=1931 RepID=UPI002D786F01|nr:hypothetical protein [Streptomyces sp.]HET6354688.1 hypothetical protein [Streptomyces sp.]
MTDTTETAGRHAQRMLAEAGIASRGDGHISAGCFWIAIDTPGGQIWFSGTGEQENWVDYAPAEHCGWAVCFNDDSGAVTVLHESSSTDLVADTAAAVDAVRALLKPKAASPRT